MGIVIASPHDESLTETMIVCTESLVYGVHLLQMIDKGGQGNQGSSFQGDFFFPFLNSGCTICINQNPWFTMHVHHWLCDT